MSGEWKPTTVRYEGLNLWPGQEDGFVYRGLLLLPAVTVEEGGCLDDQWAIWHLSSGLDLVEIHAPLDRAMVIAGRLAESAEWQDMAAPDWVENDLLRMKLQAFAAGYPLEMGDCNLGLWAPSELDLIVPYGLFSSRSGDSFTWP
ncbi:hypothetical protein [Devosia lacusdianchii]|uniref:hypothetical protein n=1 Tax=Devosia lacusdianchii TaxID=2917991 RepID=UPI001F06CAE8|nr:hypothetical protein [Devosia sp. JXJ CY 41]